MSRISFLAQFGDEVSTKYRISGERVGPFAVHRRPLLCVDGRISRTHEWVITHRATGWCVGPRRPDKRTALAVAKALAKLPVSWDFAHHEDMPVKTKRLGRAVLRQWRKRTAA